MKITKEKVIAKLIAGGNPPEKAKKMVESEWDFATRAYSPETVREYAEIITGVYGQYEESFI